jgi:gamma-glutamyl:cysteine ligase YbdK (ATP-grasp superfamily)
MDPKIKLKAAIEDYWNLAYNEGREGRNHDTPDGDAQRVREEIETLISKIGVLKDHEIEQLVNAIRDQLKPLVNRFRDHLQPLVPHQSLREVISRATVEWFREKGLKA